MKNIWINGQSAESLPLPNRAVAYGDGVFETLVLKQGRLLNSNRHLQRAAKSAAHFKLTEYPIALKALQQLSDQICNDWLQHQTGVVKIILSRKFQQRGYGFSMLDGFDLICEFYDEQPEWGWQRDGAKVGICEFNCSINPKLAGHKHLNRLDSVMAKHEVQSQGWDEGLMTDGTFLIEGTMSNLFLVQGEHLFTPDLNQSGVAGVMRETMMSLSEVTGKSVIVKELHVAELFQSNAVFLTNATLGIWPIHSLEYMGHTRVFEMHPLVEQLQQALEMELAL